MIDWHSHILPGIDDGSRDLAESLSLLEMQRSQGVSVVIATPHFFANDETVEAFLDRREEALCRLQMQLPENAPQILLGAEVQYYQGISRLENLQSLCIRNNQILLLEMPLAQWTESVVRELVELAGRNDLRIILAHVERYLRLQSQEVWNRLYAAGILMQINASYLNSRASRRKAVTGLAEGRLHFVGSDCHNVAFRAPQIGKAMAIAEKKLGSDYIRQLNEFGYRMLGFNK